jgi:hypothetical protein
MLFLIQFFNLSDIEHIGGRIEINALLSFNEFILGRTGINT